MKRSTGRLFDIRLKLDKLERLEGLNDLSNLEKSIAAFVAWDESVTIASISRNYYFKDYSFSTVKRAVNILLVRGIVNKNKDIRDVRKNILSIAN